MRMAIPGYSSRTLIAYAGPESENLSRQPSSMVDGFDNYNDDNGSDGGFPGKSPRSSETSGGEPTS